MIKKIARILFYILLPSGFMVLLGFAVDHNQSMVCRGFYMEIKGDGQHFLDTNEIRRSIYASLDSIPGKKIRDISTKDIESFVNKIYFVEHSEVYKTIDGDVFLKLTQRRPLARVINMYNESYYIDDKGRLMKTSAKYTARVPVVSGHITARYSPLVDLNENKEHKDMAASEIKIRELNQIVGHIAQDDFLGAWVDQIFITREGNFELIPRNGKPVIEFGRAENIQRKFENLMTFYTNGLAHVGWNHYKTINLTFENQIVCSK